MFGLDPFSQPVAITEILFLLALAAFVGWVLGRVVRSGRVSSLRMSIADKQAELENCRQSKTTAPVSSPVAVTPVALPVYTAPIAEVPPAFVHADPLLPAFTTDDTPELIGEELAEAPEQTSSSLPDTIEVETPPVAPVVEASTSPAVPTTFSSESVVLNRIAARANEVNFDRIGRALATEADDLKDIVGIGPFLERKLHSLGIYTFRQIANFTKEDIDKVNELIEFFPGRIERDNWVEQSSAFYERKYGKQR